MRRQIPAAYRAIGFFLALLIFYIIAAGLVLVAVQLTRLIRSALGIAP